MKHVSLAFGLLFVLSSASWSIARADVRIKDITDVEGVRTNKLFGIGLVTGLNGTGGKSPITRQFAQNMLQRLGVRSDAEKRDAVADDAKQKTDNLSVVIVTAELPPFARTGGRIDVTVSAFDEATSLQGGQLVPTPLIGIDDHVYAMASGPVSTGGFSFKGDAASVQKNHPTAGRIPNGAIIEEESLATICSNGHVRLLIRNPDFETARRIAAAIDEKFPGSAKALDAGTIELRIPDELHCDTSGFLGLVGNLRVTPDFPARVVINERTGTVVVGDNVRLSRVAITHANLAVITSEFEQVSQPLPFSKGGTTTTVPRTQLDVTDEKRAVQVVEEVPTVGDLARALNALGIAPRDLSAIFQQLKQAGALQAELEFL
ncbi:MAG: flagellar basal body P-ring protein FlgI [Planctomycetaceae bacterium]